MSHVPAGLVWFWVWIGVLWCVSVGTGACRSGACAPAGVRLSLGPSLIEHKWFGRLSWRVPSVERSWVVLPQPTTAVDPPHICDRRYTRAYPTSGSTARQC